MPLTAFDNRTEITLWFDESLNVQAQFNEDLVSPAVAAPAADTQEWRGCYPPDRPRSWPNIMYYRPRGVHDDLAHPL